MITQLKTLTLIAWILVAINPFMKLANADEVSAEDLRLENTIVKTATGGPALSGTPLAVFSPTSVNCTGRGDCVIRIEVSAQFANILAPNVAAALITVDGSQDGVLPFAVAGIDSTSVTGANNARTFCWMKKGLARGPHTIGVSFFTDAGGSGSIVGRTLTVQVFSSPSSHGDAE